MINRPAIESILDDYLQVDCPHYEEMRKRCAQRLLDYYVVNTHSPEQNPATGELANQETDPAYFKPAPAGREDALEEYKNGWRRIIVDGFDRHIHTTRLDRMMELAELNGLFDPVKASAVSPQVLGTIWQVRKHHGGNIEWDDWRDIDEQRYRELLASRDYTIELRALALSGNKRWDEGEHEGCGIDSQRAFDRAAVELAYGLLWVVGCDRSTKDGQSLYLARKALFERLDREGQSRGIDAARAALKAAPPLSRADRSPAGGGE